LDEALYCHVGFVQDGQPYVIPSIHARAGDDLLLHGATSSRLIRHIQEGHDVCVTITILDGLVLARSIYSHSMNYRSAVLFGKGRLIDDPEEAFRALEVISDHVMPGRWNDSREPNPNEMKATAVVSISIDHASAKVRTGPPNDEDEDYELPIWAGVLPVQQQYLDPQPDPQLSPEIPLPDYIKKYHRKQKRI
jgi:nitroimidazol reductase NimA-like FMN-containing flavoprotein (pyridoxamine 5'-phosphate oxidase superfamily)